ncbi:endonuclease [Rhodobacteraceae bacterium HSP-20]|uniref:Endonuclease n=1 Tax=Paragemmobacter amnigenus TaxID=2852097 RepID=A0ABS6J3E0_9RHOB|nr:endonuclease/exonuclease/phosphatase family protein [Rhodobacter amnigenus]MBU9696900.1 endonuclease [Rhodobacter amnigenus]MBV4388127.1 endonuclease [Rhodobacter amnigenus]
MGGARPLRLATYNVEWFNALFDDAGRPLDDARPSARYGITRDRQLTALRTVFSALDADGIMVIEAPDTGTKRSTTRALERFAASAGIRARKAIIGYPSETEQEIAFLYDPDRLTVHHDPQGAPAPRQGGHDAPRFDTAFRYDLDADGISEVIRFSKPPLELAVTWDGHPLRLIGVHAKSKAPHGARDGAELTRLAIDNRRKQLAQCLWLRQRVTAHLAAGDALVVLGDLNDGPGLDEYEKLFGRSGVEVILGLDGPPELRLHDPHAAMAITQRLGVAPSTARFYIAPQDRWFDALLDFVMVSPDLCPRATWRIWHPHDDPAIARTPALWAALLDASDHFPVTLDLAPVESAAPAPILGP